MIESLWRKKNVLTDILKLSEEQSLLLDDPNLEPDTFEKNVNRKAALIEKLEQLDTGFESLYDKVKEELESNRDIHKEQIRQMQELIIDILKRPCGKRVQDRAKQVGII